MIPLLLLACADAEVQDSGAAALQESPPRWTGVDLTCLNGEVTLKATSSGQAASAAWVADDQERTLSLVDGDRAGLWQQWALNFSLGEEAFCADLPAWRVELRRADESLADCWDAQSQPC